MLFEKSIPFQDGAAPDPHEIHKDLDRILAADHRSRGYQYTITTDAVIVRTSQALPGSTPVRLQYDVGQSVAVTVDLNTVRRHGSKEFALNREQATAFALQKLGEAGLIPVDGNLFVLGQYRTPVVSPNKPAPVPMFVHTVNAFATVVDPAALVKAINEGLGRKRRYGCGMLRVKVLA